MTVLAQPSSLSRRPVRLLRTVSNLVIGSLLCLTPLTAVLVLGWLSRRMSARIRSRLGQTTAPPSWLLGPKGKGWIVRLFEGLALNIRAGVVSAMGLAALTLPFSVLWLGAWWAGWENSFNKGYEQSAIGPITWGVGAVIALPVLAHLPLALAHAAYEGRFGAFFEYRRIRSVFTAAGWRVAWLAALSVALSVPFLAVRALPVFVEQVVPGFADMTQAGQVQVAYMFDFTGAALTFVIVQVVRDRASSVYANALPRAARGRAKAVWKDRAAHAVASTGREPSRLLAALWLIMSCIIWTALPVLILISQFMNYAPILWLTHPVFLLPWAG